LLIVAPTALIFNPPIGQRRASMMNGILIPPLESQQTPLETAAKDLLFGQAALFQVSNFT
jgi:hypothetical protein